MIYENGWVEFEESITKDYRTGHTVKIHKADGTTLVQHFKLKKVQ